MSRGEKTWRRRSRLLMLGMLLASALLGARLVQLQVLAHDRLALRAVSQASDQVAVPGPRGEIVDRAGRILAISVPTKVLVVEPKNIDPSLLPAIEAAAGAKPGRLTSRPDDPWELVTRDCGPDCNARIQALIDSKKVKRTAVHRQEGFLRRYPNRQLAAQLLGFVTNDGSIAEGVERTYDRLLRSGSIRVLHVKDVRSETWAQAGWTEQEPSSLMLTLDLRIQEALERALAAALARHNARRAEGVVLDPRTGEILALGARPSFDPNRFYAADPARHRNPVVEHLHEPGSVMKPFVAAALVEAGAARAREIVYAENGVWRASTGTVRDHHPYGWLSLPAVLEVSSNIGIAKFARRLAPDRLYRTLAAFGFGRRTGVDLPAEPAGHLPPPTAWRGRDRDAICFGYCLTATTLQLASAFAALANDGRWVAPHVARAWGSPEGSWHRPRAAASRQVINRKTARTVAGWLERVVYGKRGTGHRAAVPGYVVAGKTGTAEKLVDGRYDAQRNRTLFAGFAPAADPRVVIVVAVDEPREQGRTAGLVAAPLFAEVAGETLRLLRVAPARDTRPLRVARAARNAAPAGGTR